MQNKLYKEYVELNAKFAELEKQKEVLREAILLDLEKNKIEKIETDFGSFTVCKKTSWKYTEKISKIEDRLKIARIQEQNKGIATSTTSNYLLYKENK